MAYQVNPIRFRQSREALILDFLLLPFGILYSILMQGIGETIRELRIYPSRSCYAWFRGDWFLKQKFLIWRGKNG